MFIYNSRNSNGFIALTLLVALLTSSTIVEILMAL